MITNDDLEREYIAMAIPLVFLLGERMSWKDRSVVSSALAQLNGDFSSRRKERSIFRYADMTRADSASPKAQQEEAV